MEIILKIIARFGDWVVRIYAESSLFFCGYWAGCFIMSDKKIYLLLAIIDAFIAYSEFKERKHNET